MQELFFVLWEAFGGRETAGKIYVSKSGSSFQTRHMRLALPMVHCSEEVMTLTMAGREYTHISVNRGKNSATYEVIFACWILRTSWCIFNVLKSVCCFHSGCRPTALISGTCILWLFCQGHMERFGPNGSI